MRFRRPGSGMGGGRAMGPADPSRMAQLASSAFAGLQNRMQGSPMAAPAGQPSPSSFGSGLGNLAARQTPSPASGAPAISRPMPAAPTAPTAPGGMSMKKGGKVKYKSGGSVSKRADGCAVRGKTKGRIV